MGDGAKLSDYVKQSWKDISFDVIEDYDTNYDPPRVTYTAKVWRHGEEITTDYPSYLFEWYIKDEDRYEFKSTGYSYRLSTSATKYAASIKCKFSVGEEMPILVSTDDGNKELVITTDSGDKNLSIQVF